MEKRLGMTEGVEPKYPFLASDMALETFLKEWASGTLPKKSWTHAAHVGVSACVAYEHEPEEAFQRMKAGIIHYNTCVGTLNSDTSGYHETLTRFWSGVIWEFVRRGEFPSRLEAVRAAVLKFGEDRERHRGYYSFDVVRDVRARREWVRPDLQSENE
jgi:hypothetical protein